MDLTTVLRRLAWIVLIIGQCWLLYRLESHTPTRVILTPPSANDASTAPATDDGLYATLSRIEARLASLEQDLKKDTGKMPASQTHTELTSHHEPSVREPSTREPSAREQQIADARLANMLPSGPLTREDVAKFHADLQALAPEERFAMATALSRAINEGRVQPAPGGL